MNNEKLYTALAVAKAVLAQNPACILSGSLALYLQGIPLRRDISDIDIECPFGSTFVPPIGMVEKASSKDYGLDDETQRVSYTFAGLSICVFTKKKAGETKTIGKDGMLVADVLYILRFKLKYSLKNTGASRFKHRRDLIHILNSIE